MKIAMLNATALGVSAEVYLNGIPVGLVSRDTGDDSQGVNHYLVKGRNELTALISPGPSPSQAASAGRKVQLLKHAQVNARISALPEGAFPGDAQEEVLASLKWQIWENEELETPIVARAEFDYDAAIDKWKWESAAELTLGPELRHDLHEVLVKLHTSIGNGNPAVLVQLASPRMADIAAAYNRDPDIAKAKYCRSIEELAAQPEWKLMPLMEDFYDFRLVAQGRMVHCVAKDWQPILRSAPDAAGRSKTRFPMFLASLQGRLLIVR